MRCHVACPERLGSSPLIAFFDTIVSLEELASRFMNWRQLMSLSRRQLLLLPKKEDNPQHDSGKANSASRIQRERLSHGKTLARKVLASEHPMLYDHAGRPIPSDSELWRTADTEWRRKADHVVDDLLEKLPFENFPTSEEELRVALAKVLQAERTPEYIFTPHDGKLTVPVSIKLGKLQIQGAIPLYKIATAIFAGAGVSGWLTRDRSAQPIITTVAGNGTTGFSGDGGPATSAALFTPRGIAVDSAGNLYIADSYNQRIRKVSGGIITTVAGNGTVRGWSQFLPCWNRGRFL